MRTSGSTGARRRWPSRDADVWVANELGQSVSRMPRSTEKVQCIPVADGPSSLVVHAGQVWVTNGISGSVSRIDIDTNAVHDGSALGSAPVARRRGRRRGLGGRGCVRATAEHRGGTLVWTGPGFSDMETLDPADRLPSRCTSTSARLRRLGGSGSPAVGGRSAWSPISRRGSRTHRRWPDLRLHDPHGHPLLHRRSSSSPPTSSAASSESCDRHRMPGTRSRPSSAPTSVHDAAAVDPTRSLRPQRRGAG